MAHYYHKFIEVWDSDILNFTGFFGLRDFYSYIKYVCEKICVQDASEVEI